MFWLAGCADPPPLDPQALLREGKLGEALAAYALGGGDVVPPEHPTAQTLGKRAGSEPWITVPVLVDLTQAAALLESAPQTRLQSVDVSFERWGPMADCTTERLQVPWRIAVGRTALAGDPDPLLAGKPFQNVPYARGRIVGTASALRPTYVDAGRSEASALFAGLDVNPPAHRVTVMVTDATGALALNLDRRDGVWWTTSTTDAVAAAEWITRCGSVR
ncbi:hypothetical protein LBMAG42_40580 [Deltaproteobacteria bacterium]|nr:hypothetical protein LBMAG42_40580 [Deltaproteobacteria bacterium]